MVKVEEWAQIKSRPISLQKGALIMSIKYDKLLALMEKKGVNSYTVKKDNLIGQATFKKIKQGGDIDTRTIAKLCALLECQPGDLMEYVPEGKEGE